MKTISIDKHLSLESGVIGVNERSQHSRSFKGDGYKSRIFLGVIPPRRNKEKFKMLGLKNYNFRFLDHKNHGPIYLFIRENHAAILR